MIQFNHFNFNVLNLEKSLKFYKDTLNLEPVREKEAADGTVSVRTRKEGDNGVMSADECIALILDDIKNKKR